MIGQKSPADNERFYESGGVCPPEILCVFAPAPPARTFVSPRLRQAAGTLCVMRRERCRKSNRTENGVQRTTKWKR